MIEGSYIYNNDQISFDYEPFYIGIGRSSRSIDHTKVSSEDYNQLKYDYVTAINNDELEPIIKKVYVGLSKNDSEKLKNALISFIGLLNLTNRKDK